MSRDDPNCTRNEGACKEVCVWPDCMTDENQARLAYEVAISVFDAVLYGPLIVCAICGYQAINSDLFELHEMAPDVWKWICLSDVQGAGLYEGK